MNPDEYKIGEVVTMPNGKDYMYRGGDPSKTSSWRWIPTTPEMGRYAKGFAREAAQGATFNTADEIEALLRPNVSREQIQREREEYAAGGNPVILPQMMGALAPGSLTYKLGSRLLSGLGTAMKYLAGLPALGALEGAAYGAGAAEPGSRLEGASTGAGYGAAAGLALPVAGAIAGGAVRAGRRLAAPELQREAAMSLAEVGQRGLRPGQQFTDLPVNDGDVLADVSSQFRGAQRRALSQGVPSGDVADQLASRNASIYQTLEDAPKQMAGVPAAQARDEALNALRQTRQAKVTALYEPLKQLGEVVDPRVASLVAEIEADPSVGRTAAGVLRRVGNKNTAEYLIELDKALNGEVSAAYRRGARDQVTEGFRDDLRNLMEDVVPGYKDVRAKAAPLYEAERIATKLQRGWRSEDPSNLRYKIRNLSEDGLQEVRASVMSDLQSEITKRFDFENPQKVFNDIRKWGSKLRAVFGDDAANDFLIQMDALSRQAKTFVESTRGIASADRLGAARDTFFSNLLQASAYATNRMYGASFRTFVQALLGRSSAERAFQQEIMNLTMGDPQRGLQILQEAQPFLERIKQARAGRAALLAGYGGQYGGGR